MADGEQVLFNLVKEGDIENLKTLIDTGVDVNTKDDNGFTALHYAVYHDKIDIVRFLLEKDADVNIVAQQRMKYTPLLIAALKSRADIFMLLEETGKAQQSFESKGLNIIGVDYHSSNSLLILTASGLKFILQYNEKTVGIKSLKKADISQFLKK